MDLQLTYNQVASLTLLILMLTHLLPGAKNIRKLAGPGHRKSEVVPETLL